MGFFSKAKDALTQATQGQQCQQAQQGQHGDGMVHVQGAGPVDPAILGGPSTRSVAENDPIWEPINGVSLQDYADWAREAQARGINDEAGLITLAGEKGVSAADAKAALDGWVARMGQSQAVGQQFRKFLGY
jgi:hypothetical protein